MTPGPGIEPGTHWWEASALTTAPTLLVGADHYWDIVENEVIMGAGPTAAKLKIGYLLSGTLSNSNHSENLNTSILNVVTEHHQEQFDLERFWRIESVGVQPNSSEETPDFLKYY